ncbi:MAG: hypothetical protein KC729_05895 [Candidatus Eisenbacteria bacterium]|uniref:Uncharacterized protein n=1 Tax=Eiseniibacteriota bacterium TaxID=2212470 RepID=A0A956RNL1_UNCEI|nr:hypothetical protein [Candidatus Eisenbacteria bacterium]
MRLRSVPGFSWVLGVWATGLCWSVPIPTASAALWVSHAPGIEVFPAEEVLRDRVYEAGDGSLWFRGPTGESALVSSTADPQILNPGDGAFHPVDAQEVVRALESLPAELLRGLDVQIFVLPYPRSGLLSSSADDHAVYLSPGVLEYSGAQVHFLVGHELGHSYHRAHLPDSDTTTWERYREIRGITDEDRFRADAEHADRPHEIFAEDFRVLFSGDWGRGDGSVENRDIAPPGAVDGLAVFLRGLSAEGAAEPLTWRAYPNPVQPGDGLHLRGSGSTISEALLFDAGGRRVAAMQVQPSAAGEWMLETPELGRLHPGAYWLRILVDDRPVTVAVRWIR